MLVKRRGFWFGMGVDVVSMYRGGWWGGGWIGGPVVVSLGVAPCLIAYW